MPAEIETTPTMSSLETTGLTEPQQKKLQESILLFVTSLEEERENLCRLEKTDKIQVPSLIIFYIDLIKPFIIFKAKTSKIGEVLLVS